MHRLFWKIFLSFWLALVLFAAATMLVASAYIDNMREQENAQSPHERLAAYITQAQEIADRDGTAGLKSWLSELDRRELIPYRLIDQDGHDLLGRPVSPMITARLNRWRSRPPSALPRHIPPHRQQIVLPDGEVFRLVPDFQSITLGRVLQRPRVIALPLVIAALVSGLVCFLLARYVTAPVSRLRRATEHLASGDLSQRVTPAMGNRKDEIADLARDFDRMAERLEQLMTSQKQLLRDVSHELRSPLARLQVAVGLARQREGRGIKAELDRMERETERLNEMIGQLLSLARLESGTAQTEQEPVDLSDLLLGVARDASFEALAQNREVIVLETQPAVTNANGALLHSALENVVRNAIRYTPEGTAVELSLVRDHEHPEWVLIRVRDHGKGVPQDMLPRLFEPFVRVGDARDRDSGGYGLGLAIAERAVRLHGGQMSARNESEGGMSVLIRLPCIDAADLEKAAHIG
jgi:two-component system sensor histidine kinase CpxA